MEGVTWWGGGEMGKGMYDIIHMGVEAIDE